MKRFLTPVWLACAIAFLICAGLVLYKSSFGVSDRALQTSKIDTPDTRLVPSPPKRAIEKRDGPVPDAGDEGPRVDPRDPGERWKTAHIEEIKEALYEREIESVEDLYLLDEFVQVGDADTRDFWDTDWSGVDSWKRNRDGFSLETLDDGSFAFVPGEATKQIYSFFETTNVYEYDDATQEFVYETDYYGKPIVNIVKFLREDVMVLMVVSGQKVDMNIYELNRD